MLRRLVVSTVSGCFRYRVTGLAAEAAFFAILSLPPLVFGLVGTVGYVAETFDVRTVEQVRAGIVEIAGRVLTPQSVEQIVVPTVDDVLAGGRADVVSLGFVLALWSGSRALNVVIDTITIMYGLGGRRGIVKTRALSFGLYAVALLVGVVLLPLLLAGPSFVSAVVPASVAFLTDAYWPLVLGGSVVFLALLYHLSVPVRTPFRRDLPGAALCLVLWVAGSWLLRWALSAATGSTSVYGPLAAPIAVLAWLYLLAIAVLIGAALNAAVDSVGQPQTHPARRSSRRARLGEVAAPAAENRVRSGPPPL
jgi:membrane protein